MENHRNRLKRKKIEGDDNERIIKQQSKLTFNGLHENSTIYDSYTFRPNQVFMDKPIYLGFAILQLS